MEWRVGESCLLLSPLSSAATIPDVAHTPQSGSFFSVENTALQAPHVTRGPVLFSLLSFFLLSIIWNLLQPFCGGSCGDIVYTQKPEKCVRLIVTSTVFTKNR